jgi:hypothetical protein
MVAFAFDPTWRLRQEEHEFGISLGYIMRPCCKRIPPTDLGSGPVEPGAASSSLHEVDSFMCLLNNISYTTSISSRIWEELKFIVLSSLARQMAQTDQRNVLSLLSQPRRPEEVYRENTSAS